jgi:asparagine synthase (glutamine-hydrolysing)
LRTFVAPDDARRLYAGELAAAREPDGGHPPPAPWLAELYQACDGSPLRRMRCVDIETYLADCLMPKVDVATMAHGLEGRSPLLDHELLRFALGLPDAWLVDHRGGKRVLKAVLQRYLPLDLFERPKQGFTVPLALWFKAELEPTLRGLLNGSCLLETGWFQRRGLESLIQEHAAAARDHTQRLFNVLMLDAWLRDRGSSP